MDYGHWQSITSAMDSTGQRRSLIDEARALRNENATLRRELTQRRRNDEIHAQARKDNHAEMVRLQTEIAELSNEVNFYRDIVGATSVDAGPRVRGIRVKVLAGDGRYGYKLVMTHVSKDDRTAEGQVSLSLSGESGGKRKALDFAGIVESGPENLVFKFKHFLLFEGTIKTPPGFTPRQLTVTVREKSRRSAAQTQTWDWASILD